jgi:hypothetical protein
MSESRVPIAGCLQRCLLLAIPVVLTLEREAKGARIYRASLRKKISLHPILIVSRVYVSFTFDH